MTLLPRAAAWRNDLHVGVDRLHARVHAFVEEVLEQPLTRHLPRHVLGVHHFLALAVARRRGGGVVEQRLIELLAVTPLLPRFRFIPGHRYSSGWLKFCSPSRTLKPSPPGAGTVERGSTRCWESMFMNMNIGF